MNGEVPQRTPNAEISTGGASGDITFTTRVGNILVLRENGDILVKGRKTENDKEVVGALREWITEMTGLCCRRRSSSRPANSPP